MKDTKFNQPKSASMPRERRNILWITIIVILLISFIINIFLYVRVNEIDDDYEQPIEEEIIQESTSVPMIERYGYFSYHEPITASKIDITEVRGDIGASNMTQEFYDRFVNNPSCELFRDAEATDFWLPWMFDESTRCTVVENSDSIGVAITGLYRPYENFPTLGDGIIYFEDGHAYVFPSVHSRIGWWKQESVYSQIRAKYPDSDFGYSEWEAANTELTNMLNAYLTEPNGEMAWAQEELVKLIRENKIQF